MGSVNPRKTGVQRRLLLHANGLPALFTDDCKLTIESAVFLFLFPFGKDYYAGQYGVSVPEYLRMQMLTMFSPITFFTPYLLLMYQARRAFILITGNRDVAYESAVKRYHGKYPGCTDDRVFLMF